MLGDVKRIRVALELETVVGQGSHSERSRRDLEDVRRVTGRLLMRQGHTMY